jgi:hypothetical protein
MNFIERFKLAWTLAGIEHRYVRQADDDWTDTDARALLSFFSSESGQKLKLRLENYVFQSAIAATAKEFNLAYHCGKARGITEAVRHIDQHTLISQAPAQRSINEEGEQKAAPPFLDELAA